METEGFEHLKESCPAVITELLNYVAKIGPPPGSSNERGGITLDGGDVNGRRVKQRVY